MTGTGAEFCLMKSFGSGSIEFPFLYYQKLKSTSITGRDRLILLLLFESDDSIILLL